MYFTMFSPKGMFVTITRSLISRQGSVRRVDWKKRVELNNNVEIGDETTCHNLNLRLVTFKLRHENGSMLGKCLKIQAHLHKFCKRIQNNPKVKHFGINYNPTKISNIWDKSVGNWCDSNWTPNISLERSLNVDIESGFIISIWSCGLWFIWKKNS